MRGPSCGFADAEGMHFCGRCGSKLSQPCSAGGCATPPDHRFYGRRGARLWEQRIDSPFRDRTPRLVHEADADQWYAAGVKFGNIGISQQAGMRVDAPGQLTGGGRSGRSGVSDPILSRMHCCAPD